MPNDFAELFKRRPASADRPLQGQTVLVVEDSRFACEALRLLCNRSGARIRRADSLRSARRHLQTFRPSVVIVDLGLPDGRGEELIRDLSTATPRIGAIIGMSGDDDAVGRALDAGADAFLAKPIASVGQFQAVIMSALPERVAGLRPVSDESIAPDRLAVRDDLSRIAEALRSADGDQGLGYVAQFLGGVARCAGDAELTAAAESLSDRYRLGQSVSDDKDKLAALIQTRLDHHDTFAA